MYGPETRMFVDAGESMLTMLLRLVDWDPVKKLLDAFMVVRKTLLASYAP